MKYIEKKNCDYFRGQRKLAFLSKVQRMGNISICWCWGWRNALFIHSLYLWHVHTPHRLWPGKGSVFYLLQILFTEENICYSLCECFLIGNQLQFWLCFPSGSSGIWWIIKIYIIVVHLQGYWKHHFSAKDIMWTKICFSIVTFLLL